MTTRTRFTAFVTALGDLTISGVSIRLDEPPLKLNTADLPAQWVQLPEATEGPLTFRAHGGWPEFRAQLVVAYQPKMQDKQSANWAATLALLDNVNTALRNVAVGVVAKGPLTWTIRPAIVTVADTDYWAVIAEVTGHG